MKNMLFSLKNRPVLFGLALLFVAALGFGAFSGGEKAEAKQEQQAAMPPVPVGVQTVRSEDIRLWSSYSGRLHAVDSAEIRPEVSGRITEVRFEDGQTVQKGDILFVIDPRPYAAAVARAEAALASARTSAGYAKAELERAAKLVKAKFLTESNFDSRNNDSRVAMANLRAAEADLEKAKLDLEYAFVKAPISGRVSRAEITVGNLVQSGSSAPLLTSIVSSDYIYADFEVDEQTYIRNVHNNANGQAAEMQIPVEMKMQGRDGQVYQGTIHTFDNRIDTASGTIRARAKFRNEGGRLMPGMFVSVRMASSGENSAILVPERAISSDQSKRFVFIVGKDNKVAYRPVEMGDGVDGRRVILKGLSDGDRVIVDGVQHVRPDAVVDPKEVVMNDANPALIPAPDGPADASKTP
jgi:multidrug efflux system membrane fusion protein